MALFRDSWTVCAAIVCAGWAAWLLSSGTLAARRTRLVFARSAAPAGGGPRHGASGGGPGGPEPPTGQRPYGALLLRASDLVRRGMRRQIWCPMAGAAVGLLGHSVLPLLLGIVALPLARRAVAARAARRARERRTEAVIVLCGALIGEVRAGRHPGQALLATARESEGLAGARAAVLAAARFGADVPAALRRAAGEPGAEGLLGLAACWQVAVDSGAGLAAGLERLEGALRAERSQRADLRAQLAGARSTALLLSALPFLGLLLGTALGADPLRVLLHSTAGVGCLVAGGALEGVGLWWALRIVRGGEDG